MVLTGIAAGVVNVVLFRLVSHPLQEGSGADEVAISTYAINFFVGWVLFSAWFLTRADEEWKQVAEAVMNGNREGFLSAASKKLPLSIRVLYLGISVLAILSFHLFDFESNLVMTEIQFGAGFLVVTTILVLWDLDHPTDGVINVPDIPVEWMQALSAPRGRVGHSASSGQTTP
jgi:hypothetical protein